MRMEVRCCCQPQKLLGWLPVDDGLKPGDHVRFAVSAPWDVSCRSEVPKPIIDVVTLSVGVYYERDAISVFVKHPALKSEETPIERLRLIRGFEEAIDYD